MALSSPEEAESVIVQCPPLGDAPSAKESLNFQISVILWALVSWLLCLIVIGIPMLIAVAIAAIVLPIIAAVKVSDGISYRYPLTLRLFK